VEDSQRMLLTGPGSLIGREVRMLSRDGTYRRVRWNARSVPQQERVYSVGVDITDSEPIYVADHRIVHPSDDIRWLHSARRVIIGDNGDPERMRGITQDVTARKAAVRE
jgi:PAS domain-containing protein